MVNTPDRGARSCIGMASEPFSVCARTWPADLHLHTVFSDGKIHSLDFLAEHGVAVAALTDHNTVAQYNFFAQAQPVCHLVPSVELSLTGYPDTLFYFSDVREVPAVGEYLVTVREEETEITRKAYAALGFDNWKADLEQCLAATGVPHAVQVADPTATTRHLAAIIRKRRATGVNAFFVPDAEAWKIAHKARFAVAQKNDGQFFNRRHIAALLGFKAYMVLAHPVYSACRLASPNMANVKETLETMLAQFRSLGGMTIEWEYPAAHFRNGAPLPPAAMLHLRNFLLGYAKKYGLWLSIGTDSHVAGNYRTAFAWLQAQRELVDELCAPFLSALCLPCR